MRTKMFSSMVRQARRPAGRIELAKIAQRLPALLVAEIDSPASALIQPPLVVVGADAVLRFRRDDAHSLEIASEARSRFRRALHALRRFP